MQVHAVDRPDISPLTLSGRFHTEIVYFCTPAGEHGAPGDLGENEYWINLDDAQKWLEEYVIQVVSPLDAASKAEIELSEDHEAFLQWLVDHRISRVRTA